MKNAYSLRALVSVLGFSGLVGMSCATVADDDGASGSDSSSASAQEVADCKDACTQLKFFDCNDASDHAACFAACGNADPSQIELFVACVRADVCDPACSTDLVGSAGGGEGGQTDGGSCVEACDAVMTECSDDPVDCAILCGALSPADKAFIVYCESERNGCVFPDECVDEIDSGGSEGSECLEACDSMRFFECLSAEQHADCRSLCETVDDSARDTFVGCASAVCDDSSCYDVMAGEEGGSGADIEGCQFVCDDLRFFECITASDHAMCRDLCTSASADRVETFKGCYGLGGGGGVGGDLCDTAECYDVFADG